MLPVVLGDRQTKLQMLLYSVLVSGVSILYFAVEPALGYLYLAGASALGAGLVYYAARLYWRAPTGFAGSMYRYSLLYLALLFTLVMVDASI